MSLPRSSLSDRSLRHALTLTPGDGPARDGAMVFGAEVTEGWDVRGVPHGGFLLALVSAAMEAAVPQPHPLSVSATYLAAPAFGDVELHVETVRIGKRQSTAAVRLVQDGVERVRAVGTYGVLPDTDPDYPSGAQPPPALPDPEHCLSPSVVAQAEGESIRLHEHLDLRLDPVTGWIDGRPRGVAELNGWLRLADGTAPDPAALLMFSDGMPPSMFEVTGRTIGHVPTLQLTTHLFALPTEGWVVGQCRTRIVNGALVDEDGDLWDSEGRLVATTRQLALLIPPRV